MYQQMNGTQYLLFFNILTNLISSLSLTKFNAIGLITFLENSFALCQLNELGYEQIFMNFQKLFYRLRDEIVLKSHSDLC